MVRFYDYADEEVPKLSKEYWSGGYEPTNPRYNSTHASEIRSLRTEVEVLKKQLKHSKRTEEAWKELAKAYQATARDYVGDYVEDYVGNDALQEVLQDKGYTRTDAEIEGLRKIFRKGKE